MLRCTTALVLVAIICIAGTTAFAQADATMTGNYMIGGAMSWSSVDNDLATDRVNNFTFAPRGMYFMADNFAMGMEVAFSGVTDGDSGFATHRYFVLGQWVFPGKETTRFFGEVGGGFARFSNEDPLGDLVFNGWGIKAGLGVHMFMNEHITITPEISYVYEDFSDDGTVTRGTDQTVFVQLGVNGFILP